MAGKELTVKPAWIEQHIFLIRGHKVMIGTDLAHLYGVSTGALNQAVKRNLQRFPGDFMFRLTWEETAAMFPELVKSKGKNPRSQSVILKSGKNIKYLPHAFTEQGVAMLSSVLRSPRAIQVNIEIMRAFVKLREMLGTHRDLARKLEALEQKYDAKFRVVFDAIRQLMMPPQKRKRAIGFRPDEKT